MTAGTARCRPPPSAGRRRNAPPCLHETSAGAPEREATRRPFVSGLAWPAGDAGTRSRTPSSRSSPSCSASNAWNSTRARSPLRSACDPRSDRGTPIRPRVAENGRVLVESYRVLAQAIRDERTITPAAEWLVDNFSIVDEQIREIRDDLPPDYYRELPKLADGHLDGLPARARSGVGVHRPHRQPVRSREPAADGPRLPGGRAADDRRAVGDRHQPAHPAGREPAPCSPNGSCAAGRIAKPPTSSPIACSVSSTTMRDDAAAALRRAVARAALDGGPRPALPASP